MKTSIIIVLLLLAGAGYWWWIRGNDGLIPIKSPTASPTPTVTGSPTIAPTPTPTGTAAATETIIRYTSSGFNPSAVTVNAGAKVTFVNESAGLMWPASAVHPTHLLLPEFDAKQGLAVGARYSFTFTKVGTWEFHNHLKPQFTGQVVVK